MFALVSATRLGIVELLGRARPNGPPRCRRADGCLMEIWVTLNDFEGRVFGRKLEVRREVFPTML
jgi:hypothetical protein